MSAKSIGEMTSQEIFAALDAGMATVSQRLKSGELDGSGRYFTDAELEAGTATGKNRSTDHPFKASAA